MTYWYEEYIGLPWEAVPEPPRSFTCGHLGRWIYERRLGIVTPLIWANPAFLRQCVDNLSDLSAYDLFPLAQGERPVPYDIAGMARNRKLDHLGVAVPGPHGLLVLHCQQGAGVRLNSVDELSGEGFRRIEWFRHKDVTREFALCRA